MRGIPNCEPAAWTLDRTATVEQLGGPAAVTGLSITVGYASAQVETIRILGAPDAIVEITGDAWIATWLETLGPVAVEIETGNQVFTCDFASDRGATIAELSTCDFVLPR